MHIELAVALCRLHAILGKSEKGCFWNKDDASIWWNYDETIVKVWYEQGILLTMTFEALSKKPVQKCKDKDILRRGCVQTHVSTETSEQSLKS